MAPYHLLIWKLLPPYQDYLQLISSDSEEHTLTMEQTLRMRGYGSFFPVFIKASSSLMRVQDFKGLTATELRFA